MQTTPNDPQIAISQQESIKNAIIFNKEENRFYSPMPWKSNPSLLKNNKDIAIKAHQNMKRKVHKNKDHPAMVKETFQSMVDNKFVINTSDLPPGNGINDGLRRHITDNPKSHFIVNTIVFKPSSTSTKTRITNDATRKTSKNSPSINSILMTGNPQFSITNMILSWRLKSHALSTDISKFFNRISVSPQDRKYLNILWTLTFEVDEPPEWFVLLVHQFGYASTSAVAKACIDIIRDKAINRGLLALARALQFIYVDDINTSVDTKQELDSLQSEITEVLNEHGFPLKGWALSNMAPDASLSENDYTMVGGWKWFSEQDIISLQTPPIFLGEKKRGIFDKNTTFLHPNPTHKDIANLYKDVTITLPHIVSRTAMLFDMSGMSTPLIVFGNYLSRQALLDTKGEQNKQISPQTRKLFITYLHLVSQFGQLTFPRNMKRADHTQKATLLAFADSSASCWIVVLYLLRQQDLLR